MNYEKIRGLQRPEIFDPFGGVGVAQAQELVVWLRKLALAQAGVVPQRDLSLRDALERMFEREIRLWIKESKRLRLFANVPTAIHLEPYISWSARTRDVEFGVRGANDSGKAYVVALKLHRSGLLVRVRRCEHCKQWQLAYHHTRQRYCSDSCRERAHRADRKTLEGRAERAKYMRIHRETLRRMASVRVRRGQKHGLPTSKKGPRK